MQSRPTGRHAKPSSADDVPRVRPGPPRHAAPEPTTIPATRPGRPAAGVLSGIRHRGWVPAGASVEIAGLVIPGGMLYLGEELPAVNGSGRDPALIDPYLPVDLRDPDWSGSTVQGWPSYSRLSAPARGAYLVWLAGGRSHPGVPISWVFLFFYGLERHAIVDAAEEWPARQDRPLIAAEVRRLLGIYGTDAAFRSCAARFLSLIQALDATVDLTVSTPPRESGNGIFPDQLRMGLGQFAAAGKPVPADWAFSWAIFHPQLQLAAAAQPCPDEFERLFCARYIARYGAGLRVQPANVMLCHGYHAASLGIGQVRLSSGVPEVLALPAPTRELDSLIAECAHALDAYRRYLGSDPDTRTKRTATALLPPELADHLDPDLVRLTDWAEGQLSQQHQVVVDGRAMLSFWPGADARQSVSPLAPAEAAVLGQLLGAHGIGVEPDVRLSSPVPGAGPVVLFRTSPGQPAGPGAAYQRAALAVRLGAATALADGPPSELQLAQLRTFVRAATGLTGPERARLEAHLTWLLAAQPSAAGLDERLAAVDQAERESIGEFLLAVITADGGISAAGIQALERAFRLLRLDSAAVSGRVQAIVAPTAPEDPAVPDDEPVVVRPATEPRPGFAIPSPRVSSPTTDSAAPSETAGAAPLELDESVIAAKRAETDAVSALLGSIFDDEGDEPVDADTAGHPEAGEESTAGLDPPHSALLRTLAEDASWVLADLEAACAQLDLLPEGALDTLNGAALDLTGDLLTEGDDPVHINLEIAREMLA
ncbi:MAG TPA: TerB N-terminal domain-containing protein [Streptosporangiaceae bacterium]|nr:TerB N-terminal domain-containing protein [Streptosporangiaceae bacterium]